MAEDDNPPVKRPTYAEAHATPYPANTTEGDTFGGIGTSKEVREEDLPLLPPEPDAG